MGFCLIKSRWIHQKKYSWDGPSRYVQPEKRQGVMSHVKMVGREFEFTLISLEDGIVVSRSHGSGCSLCGCSSTFLLRSIPSFLPRIISAQTWAWIPAGDVREKILPGVSVSKVFFSCPVVELFKREVEPLFLHSNFFSRCYWWRRTSRRRRRREGLFWVSAMCYYLSTLPQVWCLHSELPIKIKVADIKMINFASPNWAPI